MILLNVGSASVSQHPHVASHLKTSTLKSIMYRNLSLGNAVISGLGQEPTCFQLKDQNATDLEKLEDGVLKLQSELGAVT